MLNDSRHDTSRASTGAVASDRAAASSTDARTGTAGSGRYRIGISLVARGAEAAAAHVAAGLAGGPGPQPCTGLPGRALSDHARHARKAPCRRWKHSLSAGGDKPAPRPRFRIRYGRRGAPGPGPDAAAGRCRSEDVAAQV